MTYMRITAIAIAATLATLAACGPPDQADKNASASASPAAQQVVAVASAAPTATPSPAASPTPTPVAAKASPLPSVAPKAIAPAPLASVAPTVAPSAAPVTAASAAAADVPNMAADAPPQIVNVAVSKTTVRGGDTVSGEVVTSTNVASVELRIAGFSMSMPKTKPGHFALSYQVPNVPFFFHKTYDMNVIARNTRGDAASTSVPITIR